MPIYEYRCKKCGQFELMQRITEGPLARCPTCRGKVTKLMSHTSFQLKGTGWYITDYGRKDGTGKESKKESKPEAAESSRKTEKSDTKPETTSKPSKSKEAAAAA